MTSNEAVDLYNLAEEIFDNDLSLIECAKKMEATPGESSDSLDGPATIWTFFDGTQAIIRNDGKEISLLSVSTGLED